MNLVLYFRYNLGRCNADSWNKLTEDIQKWAESPANVMGAISRYDIEYLRHYTGTITFLLNYTE